MVVSIGIYNNKLNMIEIGFTAIKDWSVEDFYRFFHQLDILYNRLIILDGLPTKAKPINLKHAFSASRSSVPEVARLKIKSIEIHSPGDFNLLGMDKIILQLRGLIRDLTYQNRVDKRFKEEQVRHKKAMNQLIYQAELQQHLAEQIRLLKTLGYSDSDIQVALKSILDPLNQIVIIAEKNKVTLKSSKTNN